jgi:hypothetical protein
LVASKSGEELLLQVRERDEDSCKQTARADLELILNKYLNLAVNLAPNLQLPYILRSKVLAELGLYDHSRQDSRKANELNPQNKRGIVSEKLVGWLQMMNESKQCAFSEMRDQLKQACEGICKSTGRESKIDLEKTVTNTLKSLSIDDLECQLCLEPFNFPIATPCGHVFCKICLLKSIDHSRFCPLCRTRLPTIGYFINKKCVAAFNSLLETVFNVKSVAIANFQFTPEWIPIYHSSLLFPTSTASFHLSEPRHRVKY